MARMHANQPAPPRWPAATAWCIAWVLLWRLDHVLNLGNLALLLVLSSAIAGVWLTARASMVCSALSVLMFNWFFVEPRYTLSVHLHQDTLLLLTIMSVSCVVSYLMAQLRLAAQLEQEQAQRAEQLHQFGETLRATHAVTDQIGHLHHFLSSTSGCETCVLVPDDASHHPPHAQPHLHGGPPSHQDRQGLQVCIQRSLALGPGSGRDEHQPTLFLPLRGHMRSLGAAAITHTLDAPVLPQALRDVLQQACDMLGTEIERAQNLRHSQRAKDDAQNQILRNTLLTSISHDYRTPLANLMSAASTIHDQATRLSTEKITHLAQTIVDEAQHLHRMTSNTLQLARLDAGPMNITKEWESLQEIVGSVLAKTRLRHPQRALNCHIAHDLPLLYCDAILLVQLFENLVENAIKYSPPNTSVDIQAHHRDQTLLVHVSDEGAGIADAWKEKVFQPFERVHHESTPMDASDTTLLRRGMGVGLAVCKAIAKVHAAQLWVQDRQPHGAVMCLSFPITPLPTPPPCTPTPPQ